MVRTIISRRHERLAEIITSTPTGVAHRCRRRYTARSSRSTGGRLPAIAANSNSTNKAIILYEWPRRNSSCLNANTITKRTVFRRNGQIPGIVITWRRPDCRSCLDVVVSWFIELAGGWFSTGSHCITSRDSAYQLPIGSTTGKLRVLRFTINSKPRSMVLLVQHERSLRHHFYYYRLINSPNGKIS